MIERKIIADKFLEYKISNFLSKTLNDVPIESVSLEQNPLGERITINTSTPGLVIGRQGANINKLTVALKEEFNFENPQIKVGELGEIFLLARIVAKRIANDLAKFGSQKFKLTGFRALSSVMYAGAMGVEIKISGKLPSSRAKSWRFAKGYLKKTGYVSDFLVDNAIESVTLKTGVVGINVSIMRPNTPLPDKIEYLKDVVPAEVIETLEEEKLADSSKEEVVEKEDTKKTAKKEAKETKEVAEDTKVVKEAKSDVKEKKEKKEKKTTTKKETVKKTKVSKEVVEEVKEE